LDIEKGWPELCIYPGNDHIDGNSPACQKAACIPCPRIHESFGPPNHMNFLKRKYHKAQKFHQRSSPCNPPPPHRANKLFTQFKAPYTSPECKILDVISKPLTFAGNSAFWGAVWGPVRILHPLWQEKGAFLKLPRLTSASGYKHYKCCITMLQGRIWGRVLGKPASGRHSHKGHRGKRQILSLHNCCEFSPRLSAQSCGQKY